MIITIVFIMFATITREIDINNYKTISSMIDSLIVSLIENTFNCFDIPFCIVVNICTYLIIKFVIDFKPKLINTIWKKRLVFLGVSICLAILYCLDGSNYKIIMNSVIIAPVSWSWILKPICAKLKIDYTNNIKDNEN